MNTYVFDSAGVCVLAVNTELPAGDFPDKTVVHAEEDKLADNVWYSHARAQMEYRTPFAVAISTNTISAIPAGTKASIGGVTVDIEDGTFEIEVSYPQVVSVILSNPAHKTQVVEVPCEVQA